MADEKVAIVTGGTYGIGRGITLKLASRGHRVVAFGLDEPQPGSRAENGRAGTQQELDTQGLDADLLEADVSQADQVQGVVDFTLDKYGRVDVLVNNAGIHPRATILETSEELWDRVLDVNLRGMFLCTKAVLPSMIKQGSGCVINVSSPSGWGRDNQLAYCASKGGVFGLSAALAIDHLRDHIRVNVVVPGGRVVSGMTEGRIPEGLPAETVQARYPLPEDIANAVAFLASGEAEMISGAILNVGGFYGQGGGLPGDSARSGRP